MPPQKIQQIGITLYLLPLLALGLRPYADLSIIVAAGDNLFNMYVLEHGWLWLTGQVPSFWNAPFFYPTPNVIAYSDCHLGNLPFYAITRFVTQDRILGFQWWILLTATFNFLVACWALRQFKVHWFLVGLGAYLFAFSLPVLAQHGHIQMLPRFFAPLAFVFAERWAREAKTRDFALLIASGVGQVYISVYTGFFLACLVGIFVLVRILQCRTDRKLKPWLPKYASIIGIFMLAFGALVPMAVPYYQASQVVGQRSWEEVSAILPRPASWFFPVWDSYLYGEWGVHAGFRDLPFWWEQQLFVGVLPLLALLLVIALIWKFPSDQRRLLTALLICLFTMVIVTTMWGSFSFYQFLYGLPGVGALRGVSRIIVVMVFPIGLVIGLAFTPWLREIAQRKGSHRRALEAVLVVLAILFLIEQQPKPLGGIKVSVLQTELDALVEEIEKLKAQRELDAVWIRQDGPWDYQEEVRGMLATQTAGVSLLTGYSGWTPPEFYLTSQQTPPSVKGARHWLKKNGITRMDRIGMVGPASPNDDDRYSLVQWLTFNSESPDFHRYALNGWQHPENWGVWSDGDTSSLSLTLKEVPQTPLAIQIETKAFVFDQRPIAKTDVFVNGELLGQMEYTLSEAERVWQAELPPGSLQVGENIIQFRHHDVKAPSEYGINDDVRDLHMGLERLRIFSPMQLTTDSELPEPTGP